MDNPLDIKPFDEKTEQAVEVLVPKKLTQASSQKDMLSVLSVAESYAGSIRINMFKLACILPGILRAKIYKLKYESFEDWVTECLHMTGRSAFHMIRVGRMLEQFQISETDLPERIAWYRIEELARFKNKLSKAIIVDMVQATKDVYDKALYEMTMASKKEKNPDAKVDAFITVEFNLTYDQLEIVKRAIKVIKERAEEKSDDVALELICADFLSAFPEGKDE